MKCSVLLGILATLAVSARAQIPSLGFCPEYLPMAGFDMERFKGIWYEAERYFQLSEVASRCVMSNYTKGPDGKFYVTNEVMSRFTGIKRVLEGEIRKPASKAEEGRLHVKYTTVPLIPLETQYNVLETDYDNYAVMWSCSGLGPVNTQNAWIMTRQRIAAGEILQKAYGVLDKYKISKVFFVKTNQDDCAYLDSLQSEAAANKPITEPPKQYDDEYEEAQPLKKNAIRENVVPDAPEAVIKQRRAEIAAQEKAAAEKLALQHPKIIAPVVDLPQAVVAEEPKVAVPEQLPIVEATQEVVKEAEPIVRSARPAVAVVKTKEIEPVAEVIKTEV
ncbi:hypothetical protein TKK_0019458 [Trichogramma kaykai]